MLIVPVLYTSTSWPTSFNHLRFRAQRQSRICLTECMGNPTSGIPYHSLIILRPAFHQQWQIRRIRRTLLVTHTFTVITQHVMRIPDLRPLDMVERGDSLKAAGASFGAGDGCGDGLGAARADRNGRRDASTHDIFAVKKKN